MDSNFLSFFLWFVGGLKSGEIFNKIIDFVLSRNTQNSYQVREKKDVIAQKFKKIFLEGKKYSFTQPPINQDDIIEVIYDIEKYDVELSNKLARCRYMWAQSAMRANEGLIQIAGLNRNDFMQFERWRREAENLADEVNEEIKKKWII